MDFDHIIFIVSTDCFSEKLLGKSFSQNLGTIKEFAREETLALMAGGTDYYYDANFSTERKHRSKDILFEKISTLRNGPAILGKLIELDSILNERVSRNSVSLVERIKNVSARLYWLNVDDFQIEITDSLIEAAIQAQHSELPLYTEEPFDREEIYNSWEHASSAWDNYIKGIMTDVPDSIGETLDRLYNSPLSLRQLFNWRERLPKDQFLTLIQAIERESFLELMNYNPASALLVEPTMRQFHETDRPIQ
ncbi:hypothetical protein [Pseudomonas purpurea]|uniref:hypothetical protein n=1 Tax=Pseudomonas purpurea TaxID=3136737 RepID=UPI0032665181